MHIVRNNTNAAERDAVTAHNRRNRDRLHIDDLCLMKIAQLPLFIRIADHDSAGEQDAVAIGRPIGGMPAAVAINDFRDGANGTHRQISRQRPREPGNDNQFRQGGIAQQLPDAPRGRVDADADQCDTQPAIAAGPRIRGN